jgi:hypothetical protein
MTKAEAFQCFIEPMMRNFDMPPGGDQDGFFADLAGDLAEFQADALQAAAAAMRKTRKYRSFPTIAECIAACHAESERLAVEARATQSPRRGKWRDADSASRRERMAAAEKCATALGRRADVEGWLQSMIDFAIREGRAPSSASEISFCRSVADRSERAVEDARGTAVYGSLRGFRDKMLERARRDVFGADDAFREAAE